MSTARRYRISVMAFIIEHQNSNLSYVIYENCQQLQNCQKFILIYLKSKGFILKYVCIDWFESGLLHILWKILSSLVTSISCVQLHYQQGEQQVPDQGDLHHLHRHHHLGSNMTTWTLVLLLQVVVLLSQRI